MPTALAEPPAVTPTAPKLDLPTGAKQTEETVTQAEKLHRERLEQAYQALSKDRFELTYESQSVRELSHRISLFESPHALQATGLDEEARETRLHEMRATLALLRETQADDLGAEQPRLPVLIVKPSAVQKTRLDMIQQKLLAEESKRVFVEEGPLIRGAIAESARAAVTLAGLYTNQDEVKDEVHRLLVAQLVGMEGLTDEHAELINPRDPELEFSEEEELEFEVNIGLEGAALAQAYVERDGKRTTMLAEKMNKLIANRKKDNAEKRERAETFTDEEILDKLVFVQTLNIAVQLSQEGVLDYWILFCVLDPQQPIRERVRGKWLTVGHPGYFSTIEEVRSVRKALDDFWRWLCEQRNRLDQLTEEDLYALSAYPPFRENVDALLRLRRGADPVAVVLGPRGR